MGLSAFYQKIHRGLGPSTPHSITGCDKIIKPNIRKDKLAKEQQKSLEVENGLIGTWSCLETCNTYRAGYSDEEAYPKIKYEQGKCKHLYFYYDHPEYGFMHVRLQTWAPYGIEISLNGREWLRRSLDKHGCKYIISGNKFFDIEEYTLAQKLLNSQLETPWTDVLESFLPDVFPSLRGIIGHAINYTWVLWQSEWARDYIFHNPDTVNYYMKNYLRHALISGTSERIIRYFGHPMTSSGQPYSISKPEVLTRVGKWCDGSRIKHWVDKNSLINICKRLLVTLLGLMACRDVGFLPESAANLDF